MKKNDLFTVTIEDMSEDGAGIGKTDGDTWFVKDGVIGDVVEAGVTRRITALPGSSASSPPPPSASRPAAPWPDSAEAVSFRP